MTGAVVDHNSRKSASTLLLLENQTFLKTIHRERVEESFSESHCVAIFPAKDSNIPEEVYCLYSSFQYGYIDMQDFSYTQVYKKLEWEEHSGSKDTCGNKR